MAGFNTKVFNSCGEYEITFYTKDKNEYEMVQDFCRKVIGHSKLERKKGKWIPVDSFSAFGGDEATWMAHGNPIAYYYCSECKNQAYAGEDGESLLTDFCPNCGADMRGEQE